MCAYPPETRRSSRIGLAVLCWPRSRCARTNKSRLVLTAYAADPPTRTTPTLPNPTVAVTVMHTGISSGSSSEDESSLVSSKSSSVSFASYAATAPSVDETAETADGALYLTRPIVASVRTSMLGRTYDPATPIASAESVSTPGKPECVVDVISELFIPDPPPHREPASLAIHDARLKPSSFEPDDVLARECADWRIRAAEDASNMSVYLGKLTGTHFSRSSFSFSASVFSFFAKGSDGA